MSCIQILTALFLGWHQVAFILTVLWFIQVSFHIFDAFNTILFFWPASQVGLELVTFCNFGHFWKKNFLQLSKTINLFGNIWNQSKIGVGGVTGAFATSFCFGVIIEWPLKWQFHDVVIDVLASQTTVWEMVINVNEWPLVVLERYRKLLVVVEMTVSNVLGLKTLGNIILMTTNVLRS